METLLAIDRIAFRIGNIEVAWYGLLITLGMILALVIVCLHMKSLGLHADDGIEIFLWVVPLGVICARLLYVFVRPDEYFYHWTSFDDFVNMIAIWEGGLTIIGGIIGGIGGIIIFWYRHRKQLSLGMCLDTAVVPVLLAQAIGRIGNFINQEAFGIAITKASMQHFPIAIYITDPSGVSPEYAAEVWGYINENGGGYWFAATFFYELVWNLIGAIMFTIVLKKKTDGSSPIQSIALTNDPTSGAANQETFFEGDKELTPITWSEEIAYVPYTKSYYILRSTYDIYDKKGNLIRQDQVAETKLNPFYIFNVTDMERGKKYVLKLTVAPTYLYQLSDQDLDNPTIIIN